MIFNLAEIFTWIDRLTECSIRDIKFLQIFIARQEIYRLLFSMLSGTYYNRKKHWYNWQVPNCDNILAKKKSWKENNDSKLMFHD